MGNDPWLDTLLIINITVLKWDMDLQKEFPRFEAVYASVYKSEVTENFFLA